MAIYRDLPLTGAEHQLSLGLALSNLSVDLQDAREFERAVTVSIEAIAILEDMLETRPSRILPELVRTMANLEYQLFSLGRITDAAKVTSKKFSYEQMLRSD